MPKSFSRFALLSLLTSSLLSASIGCGASGPKRYKVTGTASYKGSPIPNGAITFLPEDPATGAMGGAPIKDGKFEIPQQNGLIAGKYKVAITYPDPKGTPPPKEGDAPGESREVRDLLPAEYNRDTKLRAEVKSDGTNDFPFDLK